jgi:hypothetical protein
MQPYDTYKTSQEKNECLFSCQSFITNNALFLTLDQCIAEISTPYPSPGAITYFVNTMLMMKP